MKLNSKFSIGRLGMEFGWFSGQEFSIFSTNILMKQYDFITLFGIQIAKFCIFMYWDI